MTFVQRFGDALNLNVHFHMLALDGVYDPHDPQGLHFRPLPPPDDDEVARVAGRIARRLSRLLRQRGLADFDDVDPLHENQPLLASLYGASVRARIATGRRAGRRVERLGDRIDPGDVTRAESPRCASVAGVSLHANVGVLLLYALDRRARTRRAQGLGVSPACLQITEHAQVTLPED